MAEVKSGRVVCPQCGATSGQSGFGAETDKNGRPVRTSGRRMALSEAPVPTRRRTMSRAIRAQNANR